MLFYLQEVITLGSIITGPYHQQPEIVCSISIVLQVKTRPKLDEQFLLVFQQLLDRQLIVSILQVKGNALLKDSGMC